jgi:hypothetical protein
MRLMYKIISVHLKILLILTQDRGTFCAQDTIASEVILELLGDVDHVESYFGPFGDSVSVGAGQEHGLRQTFHRLRNHFGRT